MIIPYFDLEEEAEARLDESATISDARHDDSDAQTVATSQAVGFLWGISGAPSVVPCNNTVAPGGTSFA